LVRLCNNAGMAANIPEPTFITGHDSIPSDRPLFVFDGACTFCREWVRYSQAITGDRVAYAPYQSIATRFPDIAKEAFAASVQYITPDGDRRSGAHATFSALAHNRSYRIPLMLYSYVPGFASLAELAYRFAASHRTLMHRISHVCIGTLQPARHVAVYSLALRGFGLIAAIAFVSWGVQMHALIGTNGILPAQQYLTALWQQLGTASIWQAPTLLLVNASDTALWLVCGAGLLGALTLIAGRAPRSALLLVLVAYLSFISAGQVFMSYQWDTLLIETGFVLLLWSMLSSGVWLARFLILKFQLLSGLGKLFGGDPTWLNLTALQYHYFTQPLPTPLAWFAHYLPDWIHTASAAFVLFSQTLVPLLFFAPRRIRFAGAALAGLVQLAILLTGNYNFFNLLTLLLLLTLLDDRALESLWRTITRLRLPAPTLFAPRTLTRTVAGLLAACYVAIGALQIYQLPAGSLPAPTQVAITAVQPLHIANTYGLFTNMTTRRPEVVMQGSANGDTWKTYDFAHKPDSVSDSLPVVTPHQPRLDWQLWFAALRGTYQNAPWFQQFTRALLEGNDRVESLLAHNPFPDEPPRYIRARLYHFEYTAPAKRSRSGSVWTRELVGTYMPPASLQ
jgi:predicted DCC family thiol-disulfide oxidoreductase YuxK